MNEPLTEKQIENWRKILAESYGVGAYAYLMPPEEVQRVRDQMQAEADGMATCQKCNSDEKRKKWAILRQECPHCHGTGEASE